MAHILFRCPVIDVLSVLERVLHGTDMRNSLPVLTHVLVSTSKTGCTTFQSTNLAVQITQHANLGGDAAKLATTIHARTLLDILKLLPQDAEISLTTLTRQRLRVVCGRTRFCLKSIEAGDFPEIEFAAKETVTVEVGQSELKRMLSRVAHATSNNDIVHPYLDCTLMETRDAQLNLVTSDGHRLAHACTPTVDAPLHCALLPRRSTQVLSRLLNSEAGERIRFEFNVAQVRMTLGDTVIISQLGSGNFPNYVRVFPDAFAHQVQIRRDDFCTGLLGAALICGQELLGARVRLEPGRMTIQADKAEENSEINIDIDYTGEVFEARVQIRFLQDAANALHGEHIQMRFNGANQPLQFDSSVDASLRCLVMPMRL